MTAPDPAATGAVPIVCASLVNIGHMQTVSNGEVISFFLKLRTVNGEDTTLEIFLDYAWLPALVNGLLNCGQQAERQRAANPLHQDAHFGFVLDVKNLDIGPSLEGHDCHVMTFEAGDATRTTHYMMRANKKQLAILRDELGSYIEESKNIAPLYRH